MTDSIPEDRYELGPAESWLAAAASRESTAMQNITQPNTTKYNGYQTPAHSYSPVQKDKDVPRVEIIRMQG